MTENQRQPQIQHREVEHEDQDDDSTRTVLNKTMNIDELENRIRELECRLFPMEQLTWDSGHLLNSSGGLQKSNHHQHVNDSIWEEFDQEYYIGNRFKNQKKKPSFLEKLKDIEENFESLETPLVKEFVDQIQDLNIYEYESFIEEAKDLQEYANFTSSDYENIQEELPSSLLKKEALLNYINQQQEMIEHMSKSFEELEKLLPVVDMISDREQLDLLCNKLEDLKQFHLSMEDKHDLSTIQAETILKQLSAYNSMVCFNGLIIFIIYYELQILTISKQFVLWDQFITGLEKAEKAKNNN